MELTRREFIKLSASAPLLATSAKYVFETKFDKILHGDPEYAILYVPDKCIGCRACQVACKQQNNLPAETTKLSGLSYQNPPALSAKTWTIVRFVETKDGWFFLKWQCLHCENAPCARVCPTGAMTKLPEGPVVVRPELCIGCGFCTEACPFGIPQLDYETGKVVKCHMCWDRIRRGLAPACVEVCPTGALTFGRYSDIVREASKYRYVYGLTPPSEYTGRLCVIYASNKIDIARIFELPERPERWHATLIREIIRPAALVLTGLAVLGALIHYAAWSRKVKPEKYE